MRALLLGPSVHLSDTHGSGLRTPNADGGSRHRERRREDRAADAASRRENAIVPARAGARRRRAFDSHSSFGHRACSMNFGRKAHGSVANPFAMPACAQSVARRDASIAKRPLERAT
jgi:hypothetical protein